MEEVKFDDVHVTLPAAAQQAVLLLPTGYVTDAEHHEYHSTAISFYKFAQKSMPVQFASEPKTVLEQRSGDWFAPAMAITNQVITDHPVIVSVICGVISNYVYAAMTSAKKPQVHVDLIVEKTRGQTFVKVSYRGDVDGMKSAIESAFARAREEDTDV